MKEGANSMLTPKLIPIEQLEKADIKIGAAYGADDEDHKKKRDVFNRVRKA